MKRVLIASPVRQREEILREFLLSLIELNCTGLEIDYYFIDDNEVPSKALLNFQASVANVSLVHVHSLDKYHCDETTHYWREDLMWKVAEYKNTMLNYAKNQNYDFIFLVDSDLVLHPDTIEHLVSLNKDIVSEVYWTRWVPDMPPLPQVWLGGQYRLYKQKRGETLPDDEVAVRQYEFINMLMQPGVYKVGGLGACTLISRRALNLGVSFAEIYNLDYIGEDRHFCVRAAALGLELFVDTHYPAYHIYREADIQGIQLYKNKHRKSKKKITLALLVRNEADRYLSRVLAHAVKYADYVVIVDDASTDNTAEVCRKVLNCVPHRIVVNKQEGFHNEVLLRKQLWQLACDTSPDWIIVLDADEIFEDKMINEAHRLAMDDKADVFCFRLYDFWDEKHYREDTYWCAHRYYRPLMVRYKKDIAYQWKETPQHCSRIPINYYAMNSIKSEIRLKHLGWIKPYDRVEKFLRYRKLDPYSFYGIKEQYLSILDPNPTLVEWIE